MIALSWSRLSTYTQCPKKFFLQFIAKSFKEEEKSIHLVKGEQLHKQLEDYVMAKNGHRTMPLGFSPEVQSALPYVNKLFDMYDSVFPEAQVATTKTWTPTEWFGNDVGWRAIWDVIGLRNNTCYIGDYKSGRVYPYGDGFGQLHLSAVIALNRFDVPEVSTAYVYSSTRSSHPSRSLVSRRIRLIRRGERSHTLSRCKSTSIRSSRRFSSRRSRRRRPTSTANTVSAMKPQCKYSRKL